mmetsp:Transcript_5012/g.7656  ORF Transcript_5012/g.7656 Transcript_5012/m.7656 type:complete len:142 (+) Transcript_5012:116-541(+)
MYIPVEAIFSGALAACASALGKISLNGTSVAVSISRSFCLIFFNESQCPLVDWTIRSFFLGLMFACNGLMMAYFVRALKKETSTLYVTALSTSSNFVISGCIGILLFNEYVPKMWYVGAFVCAFGAGLISFSQTATERVDR